MTANTWTWRWLTASARVAAIATASVLLGAGAANAQNTCVVCSEPPAVYRCVADDGAASAGNDRAAQLVCITELARRNGHATCSVRRDSGTCDAPEQRVSLGAANPGPPPVAAIAPPQATQPAKTIALPTVVDAPPPPANPAVPQTMEEVARRTAVASDRELGKAGTAVKDTVNSAGDTLKKTGKTVGTGFTCLFTLFTKCGQ